ncbi:MAG: serine protease [Bdellovibrionales bacterium]|nr:serine protease [Bdellovibrionales bacterium]
MKQKNKNQKNQIVTQIATKISPKQTTFMKPDFNTGLAVILVLLLSSFETHARKATAADRPATRRVSVGVKNTLHPSRSAPVVQPSGVSPAVDRRICNRPTGPAAVADAARVIAQVTGAPVATSPIKPTAVAGTPRAGGFGGVSELRGLAGATSLNGKVKEAAAGGGDTAAVGDPMPPVVYAQDFENGPMRVVQMVVRSAPEMEAVLNGPHVVKVKGLDVSPRTQAELIAEASKSVGWIRRWDPITLRGSNGQTEVASPMSGTAFVVDPSPLISQAGIKIKCAGSKRRYVVTAQHVLSPRIAVRMETGEVKFPIDITRDPDGDKVKFHLAGKDYTGRVLSCGARPIVNERQNAEADYCVVKLDRPAESDGVTMFEIPPDKLRANMADRLFTVGFPGSYNPNLVDGKSPAVMTTSSTCSVVEPFTSAQAVQDNIIGKLGMWTDCRVGPGNSGGPVFAIADSGQGLLQLGVVGIVRAVPKRSFQNPMGPRPPELRLVSANGGPEINNIASNNPEFRVLDSSFVTPTVRPYESGRVGGVVNFINEIIYRDLIKNPKGDKCQP